MQSKCQVASGGRLETIQVANPLKQTEINMWTGNKNISFMTICSNMFESVKGSSESCEPLQTHMKSLETWKLNLGVPPQISLTVLPEGPTVARMEHDLLRRHECSASGQVIEQNGHFQNKKLSGWQVAYHTDSQ